MIRTASIGHRNDAEFRWLVVLVGVRSPGYVWKAHLVVLLMPEIIRSSRPPSPFPPPVRSIFENFQNWITLADNVRQYDRQYYSVTGTGQSVLAARLRILNASTCLRQYQQQPQSQERKSSRGILRKAREVNVSL